MSTLAQRLKELRTEKNKSQKALAEELNFSVPTLSHWECGYQEPSYKDLITLSTYFQVSTDYLLGLEDDGITTTAPLVAHSYPSEEYSDEEKRIIEEYRKLPKTSKTLFLRMAGIIDKVDTK